ncbi:MAG TPA: ankyrin repeat domain-containing protein [Steroidobacteraceae bacterium]|jgi:hypothetical protein
MSSLPPPFDGSDDADERYRRASGLDPSRPSEATRRAVLEHAARLAAGRTRRNARRRWLMALLAPKWRPALVGTLAAGVLVGVVIAPQFLAPIAPRGSQHAPAAVSAQAAVAPVNAPAARLAPAGRAPAPGTVESASPARAVTRERPRVASSTPRALLRESAPAEAAPAAAAAARAASDAATTQQLEQRADANAARVLSFDERAATASTSRSAVAAPAVPVSPPARAAPDVLRQAAAAGDLTALRAQLASGGDIDARDTQGRTALMLATLGGQADAVAVLLAHGADPSAADTRGTTPLQAAVAADERAIIAMLRRYGAR